MVDGRFGRLAVFGNHITIHEPRHHRRAGVIGALADFHLHPLFARRSGRFMRRRGEDQSEWKSAGLGVNDIFLRQSIAVPVQKAARDISQWNGRCGSVAHEGAVIWVVSRLAGYRKPDSVAGKRGRHTGRAAPVDLVAGMVQAKRAVLGRTGAAKSRAVVVQPHIDPQCVIAAESAVFGIEADGGGGGVGVVIVDGQFDAFGYAPGGVRRRRDEIGNAIRHVLDRSIIKGEVGGVIRRSVA